MQSRTLPFLLLLALLAPAVPAAPAANKAPDPRPPAPVLRGSQCLDATSARGFTTLDHRSLLVDGGRYRYLVEVSPACWNLDLANAIGFRGDPVTNRVCGHAFDAVLVRGNAPCHIDRIELLDKEGYKQLMLEREEARKARAAERKSKKS